MVDLILSEDQEALRDVLRDALADQVGEFSVRQAMESNDGIDWKLWSVLADQLGVLSLAVPEKLGGAGASFAEVCVVMEELGATLACVPYFSHTVLAQSLLLGLDPDENQAMWLGRLATGTPRATVAFVDAGGPWTPEEITMQAVRDGDSWTLDGTKHFVVDGCSAQVIFVLARTDRGLSIFALEDEMDGVTRTAMPTVDLTRPQAQLEFHGARASLVGREGAGAPALEAMMSGACVALAAESVGGAQRVLDMAVEYAKSRVQFGRKIGSFQAIKHRCADMLLEVETARTAAAYARACLAASSDVDEVEKAIAVALAKSYCADAYASCAAGNIQVHGGIGFTWEHAAHLFFKRAKANQLMFGDGISHRERIAELIGV